KIVEIDVGLDPPAAEPEDLAGTQIELIHAIAEQRERRHDVDGRRRGAARQPATQARLNLRSRIRDVRVVSRPRITLDDRRELYVVRQNVGRAELHAALEWNRDVAVEQLLRRVD